MTKNEIADKIQDLVNCDLCVLADMVYELAREVREDMVQDDENIIGHIKLNTGEDLLTPKEAIETITRLRKAVRGNVYAIVHNYNGYNGYHVENKKFGESAFFDSGAAKHAAESM